MMIATILIEAWDLYAIAFVLIFVRDDFNPTPSELGLVGAAVQGGALFGALSGRHFRRSLRPQEACSSPRWPCSSCWRSLKPSRTAFGTDHHSPADRTSARQRHIQRLRLYHGVDAQRQARGDGQPLAVHVRARRGLLHSRDHPDVCDRRRPFAAVARCACARRRPCCGPAVWPARFAGDSLVAAAARSLRRSEGSFKRLFDDPLDMLPNQDQKIAKPRLQRLSAGYLGGSDQAARDDLRLDLQRLPGRRVHRLGLLSSRHPGAERRRRVRQRRHHGHESGDRPHLLPGDGFRLCCAADAAEDRASRRGDVGLRPCLPGSHPRRVRPVSTIGKFSLSSAPAS